MEGFTHIYTGNGKGKTTAAFGMALRAAGAGKRVFIAQFVKGKMYAEIAAVRKRLPSVVVEQFGLDCFIVNAPEQKDVDAAQKGLGRVKQLIASKQYDMMILDEVFIALFYKLFPDEEVVEIIRQKPKELELVLTGRYAPQNIIDMADLVTEMKEVKHYYQKGIEARQGIEY